MFRRSPPAETAAAGPLRSRSTSRLSSARVRLRRAVLARRRPLAAAAAALAMLAGVSAARPPAPAARSVLVAARDLPAGTALAAADLSVVERVVASLPAGALSSPPSALAGDTLTGPVRAGEVLTDWRVLGSLTADAVPPGDVLTSVRLADPAGAVLLEAGRRIDLVAADPAGEVPATVIAPDALVVAVPPTDESGVGLASGPVVVIAVPPSTAVLLADAAVRSSLSAVVGP